MTELEYVIRNFPERFRAFRGKKIVLHGSRNYAQEIIRHFHNDFRFAGVMSRDTIDGTEFCGLPVLREADIPALQIDMIILTERVKYAEAVYQVLHEMCENEGILLYNMYGLDECETHRSIETCTHLKLNEWRMLCKSYQMVAFEAMDTLLIGPDLTVRDPFRRLIVWLLSQGIRVKVSLRKSFPAERQVAALEASGLFTDLDDHLIFRQDEDLSFRTLREENPGIRILYIGNGLINECLLPRCYGIDTYQYRDAYVSVGMPVLHDKPAQIPYDSGAKERFLREILSSEVVSFDVFDTLILRKTLCPQDVFELTELRAKALGFPAQAFAAARKEAELSVGFGTIYDIYDRIRSHFDWSEEITHSMLQLELDIENEVIIPRAEVVELLDYAVSAGKTVVLVSDMYLPEPLLRKLLNEKGICSFDRLFVSCDYHLSKRTGLFQEVCRLAPRPEAILHFGDDSEADLQTASFCGIRAEQIPSAAVLAASRGWAESIRAAGTLMERCLVGMTIAELFRDPFQNPNLLELPMEERLKRFAVGVIGPLAAGYMTWLITKLRETHYDGVLFLSRDGYLPHRIYRELKVDPPLPPSVYYYANRHSVFLCYSDDPSAIQAMIDRGSDYRLEPEELLINIYNLPAAELIPPLEGESTEDYILRHMPGIRERAKTARDSYKVYSERCGIKAGGAYAVVDCFAVGTTQQYMERFLSCSLNGFYFGNYSPGEREVLSIERIKDYLVAENKTLIKNFIELESFLSSPEPPVNHIAEDGSVVFEEEPRTPEELREFDLAFSVALNYANEFFRLFYQEGEVIRPRLPEEMFAAEGYHGVQQNAYDDWMKAKISVKKWQADT